MENLFRAAGPVNTGAGSVTKNPCGVVPESRGFDFMQVMQMVLKGNSLHSPASLQQPPVLSQTVHTAKQNNATQPRTVPEYMQEPQLNKVPHPAGDSQPDSIVRGSVPVNAGPQDCGNENYFATGTADNPSEGDRSRQPGLKPGPGAVNVQAGQGTPTLELLRQLLGGQAGDTGETLMNTGASVDNQLQAQWPALLQGGALADLLQVMQTASDGNSLNSPANLQQSPVLQQTVNLAKQNNATQPGTVPEYMQEPQLNKVPHPAGDSQPDSIVRGSVPVNAGPQDHGNENYFATGTVDNLSEGDRPRQPDLKPGPGAVNVQAGQAAPAVELLRQLITGQTGATGETSMNTGVSADNQLPAQWLALLQGAPLTDLLQVMQMAPDGNALNTPANLQQSPVLQQTVNLAKQNNATQPGTVPEYMQEPQLNKVPHPAGDSQPDSIVRGSVPVNAGPQDHGNEHYYATSTGIMQELKQVLRLTQFYRAASPIHAGNANDPAEDSHTQSFSSANGGTAVDPGLKSAQRPGIELRTVPGAANPQPARTTVLVELLQDLTGNKDHFNNYINGNFKQNTLNREQIEQVRGSLTGKPDSQLPRVPDQAGKIATDSKSIEAVQISHVKSDRAASTTNPAEDTKNNGDHKQQLQELPTTTNPNNNLGGAAKVAHKATLPVLRPGEKAFYMQLAETIRGHISNVGQGQTYVKLQLQPEHLGEVIIKLAYRDGNLSTHFHAATEHAKQIIESSIGQLRETLAGFQLNLQNVSVSVGGDSGRWGQEWNQDRQFKKQRGSLKNSLETTGEVTVEGSSETSTAGNLGKLNHFV